ncbi:hypothetical protein CLAFUW4_04162 [Fulvia fulva]|uniref:Uncharacterized protein n=1 Tax=Passalora fulva TaxID=5499 RepID=A0A9Q8LG73_PASFU|nr:uncharacterized protein CLAFUR5_04125 [Fulvia fulva]KAK4626509.1 hypothetical protein CLAFUR4_04148 [Fulvia fulva]KAK4627443.1 hypothetical protein CLAFUR0_04149 [Fulvia fulva]UJO16910.1 hypothetical protein CLAFUR5_04125 [Fulvia fulva]WPV13421.1 hypothetical protein CLAFUW4_04162 [Fulvia fulva]WPV28532.1 hypothetical protein CLAFUW7_04151 [Fulvia fulva]
MLALMQLEPSKLVGDYVPREHDGMPPMREDEERYSPNLVNLVKNCLEIEVDDRLSARKLYEAVMVQVAAYVGRRDGTPLKLRDAAADENFWHRPDRYVLWVPPV